MKRFEKNRSAGLGRRAIATTLVLGCAGAAQAVEIDVGNPDVKLRWDNTVRYNLGMRMEGQDSRLLASPTYDESDSKFKKNDIVTNRVDVLSELDVNYKNQVGFRLGATAWYDNAYSGHGVSSPAGFPTSYFNDTYNSSVSRYINGPSAEFMDVFGWTNFNLGEVPVNLKVGRHALSWGEGLLIGAHAISYSQAPTDGVKAVNSPGIETKEVFLPLGQVSFKAQVTDWASVFGQYFYEWKPTRVPMGGTYLMGADTAPTVDRVGVAPTTAFTNTMEQTTRNAGNWGIGTKFDVEAINSKIGVYYRRFDDYNPETGIQLLPGGKFRFDYAKGVELYGLSLGTQVGSVSIGSDLSMRKNTALNSASSMTTDTGARGDTLHWVVNAMYGLPKTPVWDTGVFMVEFAYNHLLSITKNQNLYRGEGYAGCETTATPNACSTRDFYQVAMNFTPQYFGVFPGWDLSVPMTLNYGIKGKSATAGGFEGVASWSFGVTATYLTKYDFSLRYSDMIVPTRYNASGTTVVGGGALNSAVGATDRGWLVFTFKTSF
ncbi:DUF1302 domain-containing protein [Cupriavidus pinatubonensis]|uniref:DUF1302 domain-containing protein n=1 Tax=Cupriavidus pinatubonensis TaxID=248026 RepID=A0ABN7Y1T5_9BURK|nr:DUF1302 family protein [Cupriavidus pinatubonensis]CAG9165852.1 hypothetical protein LMG23994_00837 [Cupriavidus pinatubonensis]